MRTTLVAAATFAAVGLLGANAFGQERPYFEQKVPAPSRQIELTVGTGYAQGFGRLQRGSASVVGAGAVDDVASAGVGFEAGVGYRIDPHWGIGPTVQYQEFSTGTKVGSAPSQMDSASAARGILGSIDVTYHVTPDRRVDPWVRLGSGYRALFEVHDSPGRTYGYHGFDWAKLAVGADIRTSQNLAVAPVAGIDVDTFLWKVGAPRAAIGDVSTSTFVFAGVQGRFDVGIAKHEYDAAVAKTELTQANLAIADAQLAHDDAALAKTRDALLKEQARTAVLRGMLDDANVLARNAEQSAAYYRDITRRLQRQIDAGDLRVVIRDGRMVLQMPDDVLFASGHTELTPRGEATLAAVADAIKPIDDRHFQIAGHTDNVPIHNARFASNWELSSGRALRVVHYLVDRGVGEPALSAAGYADVDPVADNASPSGRQANRRTEITVMPNLER